MRVTLLHLDLDGGAPIAARMRDDGHVVTSIADESAPNAPPDVLVVCLDAQPQRTLDLAARLGAACGVPAASILFVGGTPSSLGEAQRRFPKASFTRLDAPSTALASMEN